MAKMTSNINNLWSDGIFNIVPMIVFGGFCDNSDCSFSPSFS